VRERARLEMTLLAALVGVVVYFGLLGYVDPDLPGHLQYGLDHLAAGRLPVTDPYSYGGPPGGHRWVNHEWLFEVLLAVLWRAAGPRALVLLQAAAWAATALLVLRLIRRSTRDFLPGALAFLGFAAVSYSAMTIRPQMFTFLGYALLLTLLEEARAGRLGALVPAAALFVPWVNLHGGFLAGWCVLAAYSTGLVADAWLGRAPRGDLPAGPGRPGRLAVAACLATVAAAGGALLNPYGPELFEFLGESLGRPRPQISEWRPLRLDGPGVVVLALAAASAAGLLARAARERGARTPLPHALVLVATLVVSVRHLRHAPFFAISAAAFAPGAIAALYRRVAPAPDRDVSPADVRRVRWLAALLIAPALALTTWRHPDFLALRLHPGPDLLEMPTGAVEYLARARPAGNLLVEFNWAQLMIFERPGQPVFYDGRFRTVYPPATEAAFFAFFDPHQPPGWRRVLDDFPTDLVLLERHAPPERPRPAAARLERDPGWWVLYRDAQAILFARARPGEEAPTPALGGDPPDSIPFDPSAR